MKVFLTAVCIVSLSIVLWQGITQAVPDPATTYLMILLCGPIIAVIEGLRGKARRLANDKK